jgi:hypothetical protein
MKTFLSIFPQNVVVLVKRLDGVIRSKDLTFKLGYKAFDTSDFKMLWSRHLESFNDAVFLNAKDPSIRNPFYPYKRLIKLPDLEDNLVVYHIITSFEAEKKISFDDTVFFCLVEGLQETFIMIPNTASRVADVLIALRLEDRDSEKKIRKDTRYSLGSELHQTAVEESQIIRRKK